MDVSIAQLLIIFFILTFVAFDTWLNIKILKKAGYSKWWAATIIVPYLNIIMIWVFAFSKWPSSQGNLHNNALVRDAGKNRNLP